MVPVLPAGIALPLTRNGTGKACGSPAWSLGLAVPDGQPCVSGGFVDDSGLDVVYLWHGSQRTDFHGDGVHHTWGGISMAIVVTDAGTP